MLEAAEADLELEARLSSVMFLGYSEDEYCSARFQTTAGPGGNHGVGGTPRRSSGGKPPTITPHARPPLRVYSGAVLAHGAGSGAGRQPARGRRSRQPSLLRSRIRKRYGRLMRRSRIAIWMIIARMRSASGQKSSGWRIILRMILSTKAFNQTSPKLLWLSCGHFASLWRI